MNGTDEPKGNYVVYEFGCDYDYNAVFNLQQVKAGVNGKNEPKDDYVVYESGCDYAVDSDLGEFLSTKWGPKARKVSYGLPLKAMEWINIQMFTAEGGYP